MCFSNNNQCYSPTAASPEDEIIMLGFGDEGVPDLYDGSSSDDEVWDDLPDLFGHSPSSGDDNDVDDDNGGRRPLCPRRPTYFSLRYSQQQYNSGFFVPLSKLLF